LGFGGLAMTGKDTETLLDRALGDADFMTRLLADPKAAAKDAGITLTDDDATTIASMTADDVRTFANEYRAATDPSMRRAAC
jgi:hypothetical protein